MPDQPKSHFERFLRPILASRFLTVSALIHLLLIVLFGGRVLFNKYVEPPDFTATGDTVSTDLPPAPPAPPPDATLPPTPTLSAPPPPSAPSSSSLNTIQSLNTSPSAFSMPLPAMAPPTITKDLTSQPQTQALGQGPAVALPTSMAGRVGAGRERAGEEQGEKPAAEQSVLRALRWLQTQQHTDGTWGSGGVHDAFTGLALLSFLGHGETPQNSPEFSVVVTNAINSLVTEGARTQNRFGSSTELTSQSAAYQHAICTYALCEAYTMTKDARLEPVVRQAIDYIVKGQRPDGGWAYGYDLSPDAADAIKSDTSVSGWQIQALKAAHLTGLSGMESLIPVLDNAMKNMDRVFNPKDGSFGYRKAGDHNYSLTGVGVLAKLYWLGRPDRTVHEGIKNIESQDLGYNAANCNLYTWYYDTQACFQAQGAAWDWWNKRYQDQLTSNQSADGSWPPTCSSVPAGSPETGGFAKAPAGDGPVYRTTLCCLMLEVFYRYLPTTQDSALGGGNVQGL
jgi:hypothetical protein